MTEKSWNQLTAFVTATAFFIFGFVGTAYAAGAVGFPDDPLVLLRPILDAFAGKQYWYAGSLALVALVAAARIWGAKYSTWFDSDQGGALLALIGSFAATLATHLGTGAAISWDLVRTAVTIAFTAAGGYSLVKRLVVTPYVIPFVERNPKWRPALSVILWIFDGKRAK